MSENRKLTVSSSPHIRSAQDTCSIMLDVIIALCPALLAAVYVFGLRALLLTCVSVAASVFFEWAYIKLMKKPSSVGDLSAVITGMLLAYCLPANTPYWIPVFGALFAIVIVKQLYGGIGKNFLNPALAGRAFIMASWPAFVAASQAPLSYDNIFNFGADAVTAATPMSFLHTGSLPNVGILDMFIGKIGGSLGEVSSLALLVGGAYLVIRKVISCRIPLSYLLTVAVLTFIFPKGNNSFLWMLYNLLGGGLMLGAIFMATDYTTSPVTPRGQIIFGIGCGLLTVFIRYFGSYVEGVSYAILIMNVCVWLIDKFTLPRRFGVDKKAAGKSKEVAAQ